MVKTIDELAYCGNDCEKCAIYRAVVLGEAISLDTFKRWQADFKKFLNIDLENPKQLNCRGCRNKGEDVFHGFTLCPIRHCCITHKFSSCGLCPELKTCKRHDVPEGKENFAKISTMEG